VIAVGDKVAYSGAFLRRLGFYADAIDDQGVVRELRQHNRYALVDWNADGPRSVAVANLCKRVAQRGRRVSKDCDFRPFDSPLLIALDPSSFAESPTRIGEDEIR
jgi:hypothetical protein